MTITALILAHYKQREGNLKRIVDDLWNGTVRPDNILMFIDNPGIEFKDERINIIRSSQSLLPNIRFALGLVSGADYCLFLDDDLTVRERTLENFVFYSSIHSESVLGFEGSILGDTDTPYSNDTPVKREDHEKIIMVDIVIRTYFVPVKLLMAGLELRMKHPELPRKSLDDVFLCFGNKYLNNNRNYVIPVDEVSNLTELPDGGVGQSLTEEHYGNRNKVCKFLMNIYKV